MSKENLADIDKMFIVLLMALTVAALITSCSPTEIVTDRIDVPNKLFSVPEKRIGSGIR